MHTFKMFNHTLLITNVFPSFCDHPRGGFIRVQGIQQSAIIEHLEPLSAITNV
jgi:hypothetical protein